MKTIPERAEILLGKVKNDVILGKYIDTSYSIPQPFRGLGDIKLVVLGQDPTVKNAGDRGKIKTVLNLDRNGSVRAYLSSVCKKLGVDVQENVYATNLYKNFFIYPPTQIKSIDIFTVFLPIWLPLLIDELSEFVGVPMITLGEPVLYPLLTSTSTKRLREYWGYTTAWKSGQFGLLDYIRAEQNLLERIIFPFPHQPSLRKQFYKNRMDEYVAFVRAIAFAQ